MDDLKVLTKEEIQESLKDLSGWAFSDDKISKEYTFNDFPDVISFIQKLTPHFQEVDHHPNIHISYKKILFELQKFSVGGKVTPKDIEVAKYIEDMFKKKVK